VRVREGRREEMKWIVVVQIIEEANPKGITSLFHFKFDA
jgi:hypothetical protein